MRKGLLAVVAMAFATFPALALAATGEPFKVTPSEKPAGSELNTLEGVTALSAKDAFAVGFTRSNQKGASFRALVEQFNGKEFKAVKPATVTATDTTFLHGVSGTGESNVWAVGSDRKAGTETKSQSLIEHFNGKEFTRVASPAGEPPEANLAGISADSATDAWAVGSAHSPNIHEGAIETLIEHFNGKEWVISPGANKELLPMPRENRLIGVVALSPTNVYADGVSGDGDAIIEHFNGKEWTVAKLPVMQANTQLVSISASSSNDVWAVGASSNGGSLALHFNGVEWSVVPTAALPGTNAGARFSGVVDLGPANVWVVGLKVAEGSPRQPLVEHFNGSAFSIASTPTIPTASTLLGVAGLGEGPEFAVGVQEGEKSPLALEN
jgi:hypothetical protein